MDVIPFIELNRPLILGFTLIEAVSNASFTDFVLSLVLIYFMLIFLIFIFVTPCLFLFWFSYLFSF